MDALKQMEYIMKPNSTSHNEQKQVQFDDDAPKLMTCHKDQLVLLINLVTPVEQPHPGVEQNLIMPIPTVEVLQAPATSKQIVESPTKQIVSPKLIVASSGLAYNT